MFKIPFTSQRRETACGPASLRMLLAYYGIDVPLDTLIDECRVSVDGCTAADLLRVGRAHGLVEISAWQTSAGSMFRLDRPAVLFWRKRHFLVYGGLNDDGEPVLYNPGGGVYPIDRGTFEVYYSNIAIINGTPADIMPEDFFGENEPEPDYFEH